MFPIKSGVGSVNSVNQDELLINSVTASAIHEIGSQAVIDSSILFHHQQTADSHYRIEKNIPIDKNSDGTFNLYSKDEHDEIKKSLINVVMKFHILDENGLANRLTPLINSIQNNVPLQPLYDNVFDTFLIKVIEKSEKYKQNLSQQNINQVLNQIIDFDYLNNISNEDVLDSYDNDVDMIDIAVWEDEKVQCVCDRCEDFFQILEKESSIDRSKLNFVQNIMLQNYKF